MWGPNMKTSLRIWLGVLLTGAIVLLAPAQSVRAAIIHVGCDVAELIAAIHTANGNDEADTLELATNCVYTLTMVDNSDEPYGPNGLPQITSEITIHGNGATIERSLERIPFGFKG
jgi:hypothetical protein